ncbi:CD276 antigen-like [Acipenser oxyrinchus oxyrinchus]|uniref:CD276 antigen-like n=1 Tax=Acipenser oxyrinchus oxyrinchus TaxID=40147 RepID=A0AAD8GIM9_ACIOX|nr:CD276 antigen-like [Acipenser oxyrinchus oxyrinchus]
MKIILLVIVLELHWPVLRALFTVEMAKTLYLAEFGNTVKMECRFPTGGSLDSINVYWHRMLSNGSEYEVYTLLNGNEDLQSQHPEYKGRAHMKPDLLRMGRAELEISNVKISDSGSYRCLIKMGGADYKQATLSVKAPYKIKTHVKELPKNADHKDAELSCESEGYPPVQVLWRDGNDQDLSKKASSKHSVTADQLFHISSLLIVNASSNNTYHCILWNETMEETYNASLRIPADIKTVDPPIADGVSSTAYWTTVAILLVTIVMVGLIILMWKKKIKCSLLRAMSQRHPEEENEVNIHINTNEDDGSLQQIENLRELLKAKYTASSISDWGIGEWHSGFCEQFLPQRLVNSDGQTQPLTTLIPQPKGALLLEGDPLSGKSRLCRALAAMWADSTGEDTFSARECELVVLLQCEGSIGNIYEEMIRQLLPEKRFSEADLEAILMDHFNTLLILDGYSKGNTTLDESLRSLIREGYSIRILVTSLPEGCEHIVDCFGSVLKLQSGVAADIFL